MTRRPAYGRSWLLRPMEAAGLLPEVVDVSLQAGQPPRRGEREFLAHVGWSRYREIVEVSFHAVPTPVRAERRAVFFAEILPELRALVDEALTAGDGWRMLRHSAAWWWHDGRLHRRLDW